jgi:hypothetical protein
MGRDIEKKEKKEKDEKLLRRWLVGTLRVQALRAFLKF